MDTWHRKQVPLKMSPLLFFLCSRKDLKGHMFSFTFETRKQQMPVVVCVISKTAQLSAAETALDIHHQTGSPQSSLFLLFESFFIVTTLSILDILLS